MSATLSERQRKLLDGWLPDAQVRADHSWGLVGTTVLEVVAGGRAYIVKAGDANDSHLAREIRAHREWISPWTSQGRAPQLVRADVEAKLLLTEYLPGSLVQGLAEEGQPDTYAQAGELLAQLHAQLAVEDVDYEARANDKTLLWLSKPHRINAATAARLRDLVTSWPTPPATVVPTHGDWHPRNWLLHQGVVSAIDFGRAELRPALTDFTRLAARQFRADAGLEAAFLDGYGHDPREPAAWRRNQLREGIATAAWAYQVGDEPFEQQGHRMITEALAAAL